MAFPGSVAETVNKNANWSAQNFGNFESSIEALGNKLIGKLS